MQQNGVCLAQNTQLVVKKKLSLFLTSTKTRRKFLRYGRNPSKPFTASWSVQLMKSPPPGSKGLRSPWRSKRPTVEDQKSGRKSRRLESRSRREKESGRLVGWWSGRRRFRPLLSGSTTHLSLLTRITLLIGSFTSLFVLFFLVANCNVRVLYF